jgi:UDP-N-acetylmuramoyl-L-alanyl-D-glutamate--2,6-diaminopimelate ligase
MVTFLELIGELGPQEVWGHPSGEVLALSWDSRRVRPGDLFFALPGTRADGHGFIPQAIERGALGVVGERSLAGLPVPYIRVENARASLARAACAFFGHPTRLLKTIGVTGTNGKTTVVHLLGQLLPDCETLTTVRVEEEGLSCVTTPEAPDLQRIAVQALVQGKKFFAFEASSIGLAQHRVDGVCLSAAVFTGLSRDHLDFHGSMESYLSAKLRLFEMLPPSGTLVVNGEDPHAPAFLGTPGQPLVYGIGQGDVRAEGVQKEEHGTRFLLVTPGGRAGVFLPFPGRHNVENALAAAAVAFRFGLSEAEIAERLSRSTLPLGRFTRLRSRSGALVVVDFAHCPDSLRRMLTELRPLAQRLTCVFGCPGDSDRGKRPLMGEVAGRLADLSIITSDNPKSEDPAAIAREIVQGIRRVGGHYKIELDRAVAIREAVGAAGPGDVVLIAGKGHERFQWTATGPLPHSDLGVLLGEGLRPVNRNP